MAPVRLHFDDLGQAVDQVHALFAQWEATSSPALLDPVALQLFKLAVHEWLANLVQHARFGQAAPQVRLTVIPEGGRVRCLIEDTSEGFDLAQQLERQERLLAATGAPSERGRGLLMLRACTENLSYRPVSAYGGDGQPPARWQRLEFWVAPADTLTDGIALFPDPAGYEDLDALAEAPAFRPDDA